MCVLEVNLKNIVRNVQYERSKLGNGCKFCAIVKANAYSLGAIRVAHAIKNYVDCFAVSRSEEALKLHASGIAKPILLLAVPSESDIIKLINITCEMQVDTIELLKNIDRIAKKYKKTAKIHLKFNTGMNRFGFLVSEVGQILSVLSSCKNVQVCGIFSHFSDVKNINKTQNQFEKFMQLKDYFPKAVFHIANSGALDVSRFQFDMVRSGIGLYNGNHPAVELSCKLVAVQSVENGDCVGYSDDFVANTNMKVGILDIGYADGVPRSSKHECGVLLNGAYCRILAVCMDSICVDIGACLNPQIGDKVTIIGRQGKNIISLVDFAKNCDTITYEALTRITNRVERKYIWR